MPGWLLLGEGLRDWKPAPLESAAPGKTYKRGFSVLFYAPKLLGSAEAFEMCASTGAHMSFCERLYNECEPEFGKGNVPIVKITEAEPIKIGKGKSRELHFEIIKYVSPSRRDHRGAGEAEGGQRRAQQECGHERRCEHR